MGAPRSEPIACVTASMAAPQRQGVAHDARRVGLLVLTSTSVPLLGMLYHRAALELDIGVLFLVPVLLASSLGGRRIGVGMAAACGATTTVVELLNQSRLLHPVTPWWNGLAGFVVLAAVAWLSTRLRETAAREHAAARSDPLTRIANRRLFMERLETELRRCRDNELPLSVAYLDCDDFKRINDRLGHQAGDRVLQAVAELLQAAVRRGDTVARLGGDEFAVILPETGEDDARATATRVLRALSGAGLDRRLGNVSLSAGVATFRGPWTVDAVLGQADRLLAKAKSSGKQQAVFRSLP